MTRTALALVVVLVAAGCGSSSNTSVTIGAARTYQLENFQPARPVRAGVPTTVSFAIRQPDGSVLTQFKRGPGPHTGVHLIMVRSDLATIIHRHPPLQPNGTASQTVVFPAPGRYRVVVDAYPAHGPAGQTNFQLFRWIRVAGKARAQPLPPYRPSVTVDGYHFTMHAHPPLHAIDPAFLTVTVRDPNGRPATFTPWYGALAHAIFFRKRSLAYFHTHICSPGATGCTSLLGGSKVTGTSTTPGKLSVGVLVPVAGTWRLFLQTQVNGHILTAPFTLQVR